MLRVLASALALGALVANAGAAERPLVPREILAASLKRADCDVALAEAADNLEPHELGRGRKLVEARCWHAVYNFANILFVLDPATPAKARMLQFRLWNGSALAPSYSITLPQFNEATQLLQSRHLDRGLGDCGTLGEWRWTGSEFRMTGYWRKGDCDGEDFE